MGLMGSVTDSVVCQIEVGDQILMGVRTNMTPKQSRIVVSFSATYPAVLAGPKAGHSHGYDFGALKTFKDWDYRDRRKGLAFTLTNIMLIEVLALKDHFNI